MVSNTKNGVSALNYLYHYKNLIKKAKNENRKKLKHNDKNYIYYEFHHIIPKSFYKKGKSVKIINHKRNLILLTAREHYIAHFLLWKFCKNKLGNNNKYTHKTLNCMVAFWMTNNKREKINSFDYQILREEWSKYLSNRVVSKEQRKKCSIAAKKRIKNGTHNFITNHPMSLNKNREKISKSNLRRAKNNELHFQINNPMKNPECIEKMKKTLKNKSEEEKKSIISKRVKSFKKNMGK